MFFWVYKIQRDGSIIDKNAAYATVLRDGEAWLWLAEDDHTFKHSPDWWKDVGDAENDVRVALVFRWMDGVRKFQLKFPHHNRSGAECVVVK